MNTFRKIKFIKNYGQYYEKGSEMKMHVKLATRFVRQGYAEYVH